MSAEQRPGDIALSPREATELLESRDRLLKDRDELMDILRRLEPHLPRHDQFWKNTGAKVPGPFQQACRKVRKALGK